jgi:hypothetical protein
MRALGWTALAVVAVAIAVASARVHFADPRLQGSYNGVLDLAWLMFTGWLLGRSTGHGVPVWSPSIRLAERLVDRWERRRRLVP